MKRNIIISIFILVFLIAGSLMLLTYSKTNIDIVAKKLAKLNPNATIEKIETAQGIINPSRILLVNIGEERILLYEFKDKASSEKAMAVITEGAPGESSIVDSKDNIVIKYSGKNEKIINQFRRLLN